MRDKKTVLKKSRGRSPCQNILRLGSIIIIKKENSQVILIYNKIYETLDNVDEKLFTLNLTNFQQAYNTAMCYNWKTPYIVFFFYSEHICMHTGCPQ